MSCARASLANRRRGRTIGIKVRLDDFTTVTRAHTSGEPTCDVERVTEVALRLLREYAPARPVRLLGVRVAGLAGVGPGAPGTRKARSRTLSGARSESEDQLVLPV